MQTIPDIVLETIVNHRPHLSSIAKNLKDYPSRARQFEKAIADAYLCGTTVLSIIDTWKLTYCSIGEPFGGKVAT